VITPNDAELSHDEASEIELTILMPCLNEALTLRACIEQAQNFLSRSGVNGEILIADNGSDDDSVNIAQRHGARVVDVPQKGYGSALMGGIAAARGRFVIMGDADMSYDFGALDAFVERLRAGDDLVMGNRFRGGIAPGAMKPLHRYLGNPVLTGLGRLFSAVRAATFIAACAAFVDRRF
jgi:glycosyltransferase involved in cell wall biosynthesis